MLRRTALAAITLGAASLSAMAHQGHGADHAPLLAGLMHPLMGLDHVLAMLAVGFWAALMARRALCIPAAFIACMVGGYVLALTGFGLPAAEPGIAASVAILGLLVAVAVRPPLVTSMSIVGPFGLFHGHAHGSEVAAGALTFGLGLVAATMLLHALGIGLGRVLAGPRVVLARGLGGVLAGIGFMLLGSLA